MKIGKAGLDLIKEFEGYHTALPNGDCKAYWDKDGEVWTIGWGCTEGVKKGDVWTKAKAEKELKKELAKHEKIVKQLVKVPLNQNQFDALVSLSYNTGLGDDTQTILSRLNAKDYAGASKAILLYNKSGGKKLAGLVRRRKAEQELFNTPTAEVVVKSSRLLNWLRRIRLFIGTSVAGVFTLDTAGILKDWAIELSSFLANPWFWAFTGSLAAIWFIVKYVEFATMRAHKEGRYTPSKLEETK